MEDLGKRRKFSWPKWGWGLAILGSVITLYVFSYRTACLRQDALGNNSDYHLVVCGLAVPYSPAVGRAFSTIYWPLIEYNGATQPGTPISGTIYDLDETKGELTIRCSEQQLILLHILPAQASAVHAAKTGAAVHASYVSWPRWEQPFVSEFRLTSISLAEAAPARPQTTVR
ncbi:MAG: hypothetical protein QM796_18745 [Chthoniobacteraceae bacterium]